MPQPSIHHLDVPAREDQLRGAWRMMLPFIFVLAAIGVLLLVPMYVVRNIDPTRARIGTLDAARRTLLQVDAGFSQAAALVKAYIVAPDSSLHAQFAEIVRNNDRSLALLDSMATELRHDSLRAGSLWLRDRIVHRRRAQSQVLRGEMSGADYLQLRADTLITGEEVRRQTSAMSADLERELQRARMSIARMERFGLAAMVLLALLGTASAVIVLRVAQRFRERAKQEQALRDAALMITQAHGLDDVLGRIAAAAAEVDGADAAYVERLGERGEHVEIAACAGITTAATGARIPIEDSMTHAAEAGGGYVIVEAIEREAPAILDVASRCRNCGAIAILLLTDDQVHGALVLLHDRPRRRQLHASVRQSRIFAALASLALRNAVMLRTAQLREEELRDVMTSRDRLIRGFSHDVKNPLGAADGHAALLEENLVTDPAKRNESVRRIRRGIRAALQLIEDVLELARAESGEMHIHRAAVDVRSLLRDLRQDFGPAAERSGHRLEVSAAEHVPSITTDRVRVRQVLGNLLTNAIKHVPDGGTITVSAALRHGRRGRDPRGWLTIAVADDGPGIPAGDQERLFREFSRLNTSGASGAGLGLAISANIARRLGGELSVESQPGSGSTFTLWLPLDAPAPAPPHRRAAPPARARPGS